MKAFTSKMRALAILQLFIGIGALAGGFGLIIDTTGASIGLNPDWLARSLFNSYLVPGLILFVIIGMGHTISGILTWKNYNKAGIIAAFLGFFLMLWIVAQMIIIPFFWLQPLYFVFGFTEVLLGVAVFLTGFTQTFA